MSDDNKATAGDDGKTKIVIPDEVNKKYPELIPQVMASKSMDDEERNYWFSVLPIMTEQQVTELRDILATEQKRLQKEDTLENLDLEKAEKLRRDRFSERQEKESVTQTEDRDAAENLLGELEEKV